MLILIEVHHQKDNVCGQQPVESIAKAPVHKYDQSDCKTDEKVAKAKLMTDPCEYCREYVNAKDFQARLLNSFQIRRCTLTRAYKYGKYCLHKEDRCELQYTCYPTPSNIRIDEIFWCNDIYDQYQATTQRDKITPQDLSSEQFATELQFIKCMFQLNLLVM